MSHYDVLVMTTGTHINGERLRAERLRAGLSQRDLASLAGVGQRSISCAERGFGLRPPTRAALERALDLPAGSLDLRVDDAEVLSR